MLKKLSNRIYRRGHDTNIQACNAAQRFLMISTAIALRNGGRVKKFIDPTQKGSKRGGGVRMGIVPKPKFP